MVGVVGIRVRVVLFLGHMCFHGHRAFVHLVRLQDHICHGFVFEKLGIVAGLALYIVVVVVPIYEAHYCTVVPLCHVFIALASV